MTIAALGISVTSSAQISSSFDRFEQTEIQIRRSDGREFDLASAQRFRTVDGVLASTAFGRLSQEASSIYGDNTGSIVIAADAGFFSTFELLDWEGRSFDRGFVDRSDAVAVVGAIAARELGLAPPFGTEAINVGGRRITVIGMFGASPRDPLLATAAIVPRTWAEKARLEPVIDRITIRSRIGATTAIASKAATIADPYQSDSVLVAAPPTVEQLRASINEDLDIFIALTSFGAVTIGSLGIAHAAFTSVLRRQGELALRQALGATALDLAILVVVEGMLLGFLAGVGGAVSGIAIVLIVSLGNGWTPLLEISWVLGVVVVATGLGSIMSIYPAFRASRVEPAIGLRQL